MQTRPAPIISQIKQIQKQEILIDSTSSTLPADNIENQSEKCKTTLVDSAKEKKSNDVDSVEEKQPTWSKKVLNSSDKVNVDLALRSIAKRVGDDRDLASE